MRLVRLVAVVAFALLTSRTPAAEPTRLGEAELRKLFERELDPRAAVAFDTPSGVKGKVEAAAPVEVASDEEANEVLTVKLGTGQPVVCTLSAERIDAATSVRALASAVAKSLEVVQVRTVEVSGEAGNVVLFAEISYRQQTEKGALAGLLKIAVHPRPDLSFLCHHDEPGYSASFRRVVKGLAASLSGPAPDLRAQARFAEILVAELDGRPIGYVERGIWAKDGGDRVSATFQALLLPRSPRELTSVDEANGEVLDADGLITAANTMRSVDGAIDLEVELETGAAPGTFRFKGQQKGKPIEGTFQAKEGLASELWFAKRLTGAKKPAGTLAHDTFSAGADPTRPVRFTHAPVPDAPGRATVTVGPTTVTGELDEFGLMKRVEMPAGPAKLTMKRVWSRGSP